MKILPPSQINNMPILEEVLEELRLSILDRIQYIYDALDLYSLSSEEIKKKLNLLGLVSITIGNFIKLSLTDKEFEYISPAFYKAYRKLNQHRGNRMSMDYILHSAGMMNILVHSNQNFYQGNIFSNAANFFEFNTFRDNQISDLDIGDGYIIVPYTSNRSQVLKQYLATNPIIFEFLPAGYTFIFLSEYRNSYNNGIHQYDNFLNFLNDTESLKKDDENFINPQIHNKVNSYNHYWEDFDLSVENYIKPRYWENMNDYSIEEIIILPDNTEFTVKHDLHYYEPIIPPWRDSGIHFNVVEYPRYTYDPTYGIQLIGDFEGYQPVFYEDSKVPYAYAPDDKYYLGYHYKNLTEYLYEYGTSLSNQVFLKWSEGLEADLNNILNYRDVWLGDYLISTLQGSNVYSEFYDHIKGLIAPFNASSSTASLYQRGETVASQYEQREGQIVSVNNDNLQTDKPKIITDRKEVDLFKFNYNTDRKIDLIAFYDLQVTKTLLSTVFGYDNYTINSLLEKFQNQGRVTLIEGIDVESGLADAYYNDVITTMRNLENTQCNDVIIEIIDGLGNVVRTNNTLYSNPSVIDTLDPSITRNVHVEFTEGETNILSQNMQKIISEVNINASMSTGTETLYLGQTPVDLSYIDLT